MTPEQALGDVRTVLIDAIGAKGAPSADICMVTQFEADLELESDEFVKLCAIPIEHCGDRLILCILLPARISTRSSL